MSRFRAPGRVNLMGDHTDYHDGFVLPVAIDRECVVAIEPRDDGRVTARSEGFEGAVDVDVAADLDLTSTVPPGAGLSSSAALEVASALALCAVGDAERRAHGERVAADLGLASPRDADPEHPPDDPVARHVVTENARVATALALAAGDLDTVAANFAASQASLRDDVGCSTPEINVLVAELLDAGALGARITGAGWGGYVVALALPGDLHDVIEAAGERDHWLCRAVAGAGPVGA